MSEYIDKVPAAAGPGRLGRFEGDTSAHSAVSWGAIFAGAAAAASLSLILLLLGSGLGLSSVSPWANQGASAKAIGLATIAWITFTQIAASGMGGYLAGRLRTKWAALHTDEVYFRDTAHGFLAWGVATIATAALLTSAIGSILGAGAEAGATVAGGAATAVVGGGAAAAAKGAGNAGESSGGATDYFVDSLFRKPAAAPGAAPAATPGAAPAANGTPADGGSTPRDNTMMSSEVTRIFANALKNGTLAPDDAKYVGQLVAQRTGISQEEAEKRVNDTYARAQAAVKDAEAKARAAADAARKASAYASLWLFISLLIGAFVASLAATWGGRRRDL